MVWYYVVGRGVMLCERGWGVMLWVGAGCDVMWCGGVGCYVVGRM